jgi:methylation protein EvaC
MSFGRMPIANGFLTEEQFGQEYFFELAPAFCERCGMFQIIHQPDPARMFHENYAFFSQTSRTMEAHFQGFAKEVMGTCLNGNDPFVVEIGSNDGIMLKHFAAAGIRHVGVEPSSNVAAAASANGVNTVCTFFDEESAAQIRDEHGQADVILAANVMCHIPDLHSVATGVGHLLKPGGVLTFEDPDLGDGIEKTSYDQIYDEHVFLFSVRSVVNAFADHELEVIDIAPLPTHGGSMRYVLAHKGRLAVSDNFLGQIEKEDRLGLDRPEAYLQFRHNCETSRDRLMAVLLDMKTQHKRVVGYGATSKSTTVTNYCGITADLVDYICDTTPTKQGKYSPGVHIPVRPYESFCEQYPDAALLLAWNHAKEIMAKEEKFRQNGGKWIRYVPKVEVI